MEVFALESGGSQTAPAEIAVRIVERSQAPARVWWSREVGEEVDVYALLVGEMPEPPVCVDEGADTELGEQRQPFDGAEELHIDVVPKRVHQHRHERRLALKVVGHERLVHAGLVCDAPHREATIAVAHEHAL